MTGPIDRRRLLGAAALGGGSLILAGCDRLNGSAGFRSLLQEVEGWNMASQRLIGGQRLAPEFSIADLSPDFRANGSRSAAGNAVWEGHVAAGFANWALRVDGLVRRPLDLSIPALAALPQQTQITRHDCVEGWSAIGQWTGPRLGPILRAAGLLPQARFIVFHCADTLGSMPYYESIDLLDAFHPQTILALRMNGQPLPVRHGAPLRLRVERQLGYKQAKYIMRVEARASLAGLYGNKGGYWEDHSDYPWYAGI